MMIPPKGDGMKGDFFKVGVGEGLVLHDYASNEGCVRVVVSCCIYSDQ